MSMTINVFSVRTGLPPSTLRFYDKKKLLQPSHRSENGYRVYTEEQISIALIIHSLRQADVAIDDIKHFLVSSDEDKHDLISKWRQEVETKLSSIRIAKQYLGGIRTEENHIHLMKWEEQTRFIWFKHTVQRKIQPFKEVMESDLKRVRELGIRTRPDIYIKTIGSKGNTMVGEIGFVLEGQEQSLPISEDDQEVYIDVLEPTLFATMQCEVTDSFTCFNFIHMLQRYGFEARGYKLEKFESLTDTVFKYLIPLAFK